MSNMSYCRFRNTLGDLREDEARARKRLIALCQEIAQAYADEEDED